jgi:eukaryotic-like serine/threonine-protein kinase
VAARAGDESVQLRTYRSTILRAHNVGLAAPEIARRSIAPAAAPTATDHKRRGATYSGPVNAGDRTEVSDGHAVTLASDAPGPRRRVADSELERGAMLGRYLVVAPLGAGGMGVVYAAYDPELDRKVAIKLWHTEAGAATSADLARGRLQREAQALARLAHPNVVAVHDVGTIDGRVFVAMEFIDGWTLGDWQGLEPRSRAQIVEVFLAAGRGLAAAHASGLVHRDIKPDNIMIGRDGRVRVMDFGLARTDGTVEPRAAADGSRAISALSIELTRTGGLLGTPAYMAPEQFHQQTSDARGDQFSFCVSLYEALYGERPFTGSNLGELAHNVVQGHVRPAPRGSSVPPALRRALLRGLQPDPAARFPDMPALLAELTALTRQPGARRLWLIGGGLTLALAGSLGAAVLRDRPLCEGAEARWEAIWGPTRAAAVHDALLATGRPHATATAARVDESIAEYGRAWTAMHRDACLATRARGEQSDSLLDLRMRCLGEQLQAVDALVAQLETADADAADRAVQAVLGLAPLAACADAEALAAAVPPPVDAAARAAVEAQRARLAELDGMYRLGRYKAGRTLAAAVLADSEATGYGPLIGEARRSAADFAAADGDPTSAEPLLFAAIDEAAGARDLEGHARAWIALTRLQALDLRRPEDALRNLRAMRAAVQLLPASPALRASAAVARATTLARAGDLAGSLLAHDEARALLIEAHGPDDPRVANLDNSLGTVLRELDRDAEARVAFERALELGRRTLGEQHPSIAGHLINLANLDTDTGRLAEARERMTRALRLREATLGPQHYLAAQIRYNLANLDRLEGDLGAARRGAEAALASFEQALGPDHANVAIVVNFLGALAEQDGRLADAEQLYARALALSERTLGVDNLENGTPLINLGKLDVIAGRFASARPRFARGLALWEKAYGPDHTDLVEPLIGLGRVALAEQAPRVALALGERALGLVAARDDLAFARAEASWLVAAALRALRRDLPRARSLAAAARAGLDAGAPSDRLRAEIDALERGL